MINEFITFVSETMPCISPYTKEGIKNALQQFKINNKKFCTTMRVNFDELCQGDILENIPFYRINKSTGKISVYTGKGVVLSNTCDCSRDETILIAPFMPIGNMKTDQGNILSNKVYRYLYLPDKNFEDFAVDFSLTNTFNREIILKGLDNNAIKKNKSLNGYGYYLLICKLTIYLLRPEDAEVNKSRLIEEELCG